MQGPMWEVEPSLHLMSPATFSLEVKRGKTKYWKVTTFALYPLSLHIYSLL